MLHIFPKHLQERISEVQRAIQDLEQRWPSDLPLKAQDEPSIYDCYPFLFYERFSNLDPHKLHQLTVAARLFASAIFIYDALMDQANENLKSTFGALRNIQMQFETYQILHKIFPKESLFWDRFQAYIADFTRSCLIERQLTGNIAAWADYTEDQALGVIIGKDGIVRAVIAGMAELGQQDSYLDAMVETINQFNIGYQMLDDLCDWKDDLQRGSPSLLLARMIRARPGLSTPKEWAYDLYYGGHATYVLEKALQAFDRSDALLPYLPDLTWYRITASQRHRCQELLRDINQIIAKNLRRLHQQPAVQLQLAPPSDLWQDLAWQSLAFIREQWLQGFGEAQHLMRLAVTQGFSVDQEVQAGDIFQRAIIADALCDADPVLQGQLQPMIDYEAQYLIERRQREEVGGWKYFPPVPEIAPDADDLAQVMQVLLRAGHHDALRVHCEPPLAVLLRDGVASDGSIGTWIIPRAGRTATQERQVLFNETKWGSGPDNEVVANILYALALYDAERFFEVIQRGCTYLEGRQRADGSWSSTWYYGQYYGTYVCLRLLAHARPSSAAIQQAHRFLGATQADNGGWGMDAPPEALSTALALLCLAAIQHSAPSTDIVERALRASEYLRACQISDALHVKVPFIRPRPTDPYSSKTITSAYVLKASLAWHTLLLHL